MARVNEKLTALAVSKATKPGYYGDGAGLWLQVSKSGSKSWIFRFTIKSKQREMGLGAVHTVTLSEARAKAKECRVQLLDGRDPLDARQAKKLATALEQAKMITFDQCAAAYIRAHSSGWKHDKHVRSWENSIATHASPVIGSLPVVAIDTGLVVKVLSPIWESKTAMASMLRGRLESILGWATTSEYRTGDNPARWKGHLENLLAAPGKLAKTEHHPALPWMAMGAFMAALRQVDNLPARLVEFSILTACRPVEGREAIWREIDMDAKLWVIPPERMKGKVEHRVPLSTAACDLLNALPRLNDFVFPGARRGRPLSESRATILLANMGHSDITMHGMRSSFRDWCSESVANSFPREVCEHALAHSLPDKVEAAYRRGDLIEKRSMLMQAWADYCAVVPTAANVTPIRGAAVAA